MDEHAELYGGWPSAALRSGGLDGARALLAMQDAALAAMTPLAHDWLHRRQESVAAARRLLDGLGTATDPMAAIQAQQIWWTGAAERLTQDAGTWAQFGMALLRTPGAGVMPAGWPKPAVPGPRSRTPGAIAA